MVLNCIVYVFSDRLMLFIDWPKLAISKQFTSLNNNGLTDVGGVIIFFYSPEFKVQSSREK